MSAALAHEHAQARAPERAHACADPAASAAPALAQTPDGVLPWHDQATLLGVNVKVHFFSAAVADSQSDPALHALPVLLGSSLPRPLARPELLAGPGGSMPRYQVGALWAVPDVVLRHGGGLISVLRHNGDIRQHAPRVWRDRLRSDLMLQCLATAMAVSGQTGLPTAAVWRAGQALYLFDPSAAVLAQLVAELPGLARLLKQGGQAEQVSAAQLASFCEPRWRLLLGASANAGAGAPQFADSPNAQPSVA